jgi:AcrR family transcriptional regulator
MPAPTDHPARRREIARDAVHSIARSGWDGATLRSVADEGGWSVGVVQHYFRNKSQVLVAAVDYLVSATYAAADGEAVDGLDWLKQFARNVVPHHGHRSEYWRVWICFWAQAQTDSSLRDAVAAVTEDFQRRLEVAIRRAQEERSVRADIDPVGEAAFLAAAVIGLGITSCLDPSNPPSEHMVDRLLARLVPQDASTALPTRRPRTAAQTPRSRKQRSTKP